VSLLYRGRQEWLIEHPILGDGDGATYGFALIPGPLARQLTVIFSGADETGWEHVSVSMPTKTPAWAEMAFIKSLFWADEDTVMQVHPPKSNYVNTHEHCLHLWRPVNQAIPMPPTILV
jgi:hypothetical protein